MPIRGGKAFEAGKGGQSDSLSAKLTWNPPSSEGDSFARSCGAFCLRVRAFTNLPIGEALPSQIHGGVPLIATVATRVVPSRK